jgi:UDP:flavonoid glycosyltransferase YjiC (YdhE family)
MRILMSTHRPAGHVGPMIPFAHALQRAGHEVMVAIPRTGSPLVARARLDHELLDEPPEALEAPLWAEVKAVAPERATEIVVVDLFGRLRGGAMLGGLLELVEGWGPDVVVHEILEIAAVAAAERYGVPHARVGIGLVMDEHWGLELMNRPLDELRAGIGIRRDPGGARLADSPYLTLAPPSLELPSPRPRRAQRFRATGRIRPLPEWWDGAEEPLVYVSYGTAVPELETFRALCRATIDALAELPVRVLLTVGHLHDPADFGPLPASVHVERWVPQTDVMPHAAAMVGHGGSGSTLMAMAAGVPLAVVPFFADQGANAERVAQLGAGIALEPDVAGLAGAVEALLQDPIYRRRAGLIAAEVAALPPVDEAVPLLEEIADGRALAA